MAEVASTSPSGPCAVVPMQSPPSYDPECDFLHDPTGTIQPRAQPLGSLHSYPYGVAVSQYPMSPSFESFPRETTVSLISPDLIYPPLHNVCFSTTAMSQSSHPNQRAAHHSPSPSPYLSPPPEPSSQTVVPQQRNVRAPTGHSSISLSVEQPPETTMACISPERIYPSAHCQYGVEDDRWTDVSSQSSRASRRAIHLTSPYPTPSPSPSPRISSIILASQRRNAPVRGAAPVPVTTWQCPYCPCATAARPISSDTSRRIRAARTSRTGCAAGYP